MHGELLQRDAHLELAALHGEVAVAAPPGQLAAQVQRVRAPVVPAQSASLQVGLKVRRLAGAGHAQRALDHAGGGRKQVVQLQRLQLRGDVEAVADAAVRAHAAAAKRQGKVSLALVAAQHEAAAARQRAPAQAPAQRLHVGLCIEAARVAGTAGGGDAALDVAVPARCEVAGVEAVQHQRQVPVEHRVPASFAGGLQRAGGHGRLQRMDAHARRVAAQVQHQVGLLVAAAQGGIAIGGPLLQRTGQAQRRIDADRRRGRILAFEDQVAGHQREAEAAVFRVGEVGAALEHHLAALRFQRQRRHGQHLVLEVDLGRGDGQLLRAAADFARQTGAAAGAAGDEVERDRFGGRFAAGEQRRLQALAAGLQAPRRRILVAAEGERGAQRLRRAPTDAHFHLRQVAACEQAQPRRALPARRRQHRRHQDIAAVVFQRLVAAVHGEQPQVAVDRQALGMQRAVGDVDAAAQRADVDHVLAAGSDVEAVDDDAVGLDRQRHFYRRQRLGPARQLERFVAARQVERGALDLERVKAQAPAQQRADVRIQVRAPRGEAVVLVAEIEAVDRQRPGDRPLDLLPGQGRAGGQARDDLRQQHVAAGHRLQQPVQEHHRGDDHRQNAQSGPGPEAAPAVEARTRRRRWRRR